MRPRRLVPLLAATLASALATGSAVASPPPALQTQRARERAVVAQIDRIGANLEQVVQAWDGARLRLQAVEQGLRLNTYALGVARQNLRASQARLEQRLVSLYEHQQPGTLDVLAGATSLTDLIDRIEATKVLSSQDAAIAQQTVSFTVSVQRREALLRRQRRERAATVAELASRRRTIEGALAEQQRLLASIHRTIGQLLAEQAARERRLQALAQARIAREIAARQAQQQAQDGAPAPATGLVTSPAGSAIPSTSSPGHPQAASIAAQYLGVPYVWGGASPAGFDCSGLVMYVYAQLGISLPHYTVSQWNATLPVPTSEMQPGDLVFFDGLGHVGIYIGNGQFIDAPYTGAVVRVDSLAGSGLSFDGARRVP